MTSHWHFFFFLLLRLRNLSVSGQRHRQLRLPKLPPGCSREIVERREGSRPNGQPDLWCQRARGVTLRAAASWFPIELTRFALAGAPSEPSELSPPPGGAAER